MLSVGVMHGLPGSWQETCASMATFGRSLPVTLPPSAARQDYSRPARDPAIAERPDRRVSFPKDGRMGRPSGESRFKHEAHIGLGTRIAAFC